MFLLASPSGLNFVSNQPATSLFPAFVSTGLLSALPIVLSSSHLSFPYSLPCTSTILALELNSSLAAYSPNLCAHHLMITLFPYSIHSSESLKMLSCAENISVLHTLHLVQQLPLAPTKTPFKNRGLIREVCGLDILRPPTCKLQLATPYTGLVSSHPFDAPRHDK